MLQWRRVRWRERRFFHHAVATAAAAAAAVAAAEKEVEEGEEETVIEMETEAEVEAEAAAGDLAAAEAAVEESSDGGKSVDQKGKFRHPAAILERCRGLSPFT